MLWAREGSPRGPEAPYLKSPSTTGGEFARHFPIRSLSKCPYAPSHQAAQTDAGPERRPTPTPELLKGEWVPHSTSTRLSVSERPAVASPRAGRPADGPRASGRSCQEVKSSISEPNWRLKILCSLKWQIKYFKRQLL